MKTHPASTVLAEVEYPTEDGKPMGETGIHARVMREVIEVLENWYADDPMAFTACNLILYYVEGDPRKQVVPDVFVAEGVPKEPERDTYLLWREPKGPDVIVEVTSKTTADRDLTDKLHLYRDVLRVQEYFLFDPRPKTRRPPLRGFRLVDGEYVPIEMVDGRLPSEILGLHLETDGGKLRLYDPETKQWLLSFREKFELAEEARRQAEADKAQAEEAWRQAEAERARVDEARRHAEADNDRLLRELDTLRKKRKREK
jgi:Uma2 family endonuclease